MNIHSVCAALTLGALGVLAQTESIAVPPVPAELQPPQGNIAFMRTAATGTQNYMCLPSATGVAWKFFAPQATLFLTYKLPFSNTEIRQQIATHFLSANPEENGTLRPTWHRCFRRFMAYQANSGKCSKTSSAIR